MREKYWPSFRKFLAHGLWRRALCEYMCKMIFSLRVDCHVAHVRVLIGKILDETYENLLMKYHVTLVTLLVYRGSED